jgi:hypothetical protein
VAQAPHFPRGSPRTFVTRFNPRVAGTGGFIFAYGSSAQGQIQALALTSTGLTYVGWGDDWSVSATIPLNAWSVVGCSFDGVSQAAKIYLNGTLLGTTYHLGHRRDRLQSGWRRVFNGTISDVLVYQSVLMTWLRPSLLKC